MPKDDHGAMQPMPPDSCQSRESWTPLNQAASEEQTYKSLQMSSPSVKQVLSLSFLNVLYLTYLRQQAGSLRHTVLDGLWRPHRTTSLLIHCHCTLSLQADMTLQLPCHCWALLQKPDRGRSYTEVLHKPIGSMPTQGLTEAISANQNLQSLLVTFVLRPRTCICWELIDMRHDHSSFQNTNAM